MERVAAPSYQSFGDFLGGVRLWPDDPRAALKDAALAIVVITAVIVVADGLVFRSYLPSWYINVFAGPALLQRILVYMERCVSEEITYRLLLMTAIIAIGARLWGKAGRPPAWVVWAAILVAQAVNVLPKTPGPQSWPQLPWLVLRFYMPGVVWGWLYWRRGFVTPLLAHPLVHLILQPLLLLELAR